MSLLNNAKDLQSWLVHIRRQIHAFPEISGEEQKTAKYIIDELHAIGGYKIRCEINGHGIIADLESHVPGPRIALRADMDALHIQEETGLSFASKNSGVMHACGHDAHVTMLLGAAKLLYNMRDQIKGSVRLIFQPAEELSPIGGARGMILAGALEDVDSIYGLHVWPYLPMGVLGTKSGTLMASSDHFEVQIDGRASHGAKPSDGLDAIVAGAQFVNAVQTIVSRNIDPMQSAVISIGECHAGTRYNIIAEQCRMEGTCRTFNMNVRDVVENRLKDILHGVCQLSGCRGCLNYERGYPPVINDLKQTEYLLKTAEELFGVDRVAAVPEPSTCAEDFAFYLQEKPGAFAWLGTALPGEEIYPLHNSHFTIPEDILWNGAAFLAQLVIGAK